MLFHAEYAEYAEKEKIGLNFSELSDLNVSLFN
jgi:hypothetical protein